MALFARNGWTGVWRSGIYADHHYHSTAHEVLRMAAGSARVRLGGEAGKSVVLNAGDVVVIPAGLAHKGEPASPDLLVVGAYQRPEPGPAHTRRASTRITLANIATLLLPLRDPVSGAKGPLLERWRADASS